MTFPPTGPERSRSARFHVAVQRSRLGVYVIGSGMAGFGSVLGILEIRLLPGLVLFGLAVLSALVLIEVYRRGLDARLALDLSPAWMALDVVLISWGVDLTGGLESPWYLWYLANASAAAFVGGQRAAALVGTANSLAYLGVLVASGEVRAFDRDFLLAGARMAFLFGAAFFFLRGVTSLQERTRLVRRLQQEQDQKLEQLLMLTQDLDQGTRALAEANIRIREADRMKSQFLANMSHELRTPLNSIIGFSEIMLERLSGEIPTKYVKFLNNIHSSGQHLLGIINDILDLSKVEAGRMEVRAESLRVGPAIEGVLNVMHGMASQRRVSFAVEVPEGLPAIETDPAKFKQILYNLLSNAVKFSPEGASVGVQARHLAPEASPLGVESLSLAVIDKGIGIAAADQEVIFHEFRQADGSATRQFGGTGLGLALVKKFTELQGGQIGLESEPGKGSRFSVTLPLRAGKGATPEPPLAPEALLPMENRILVVEDDLVAFQSLSRSLSAAGYFPIRARHGEEALQLARSLKPRAITLDLGLPGLSGWEVLKELKKDPATRGIPVVIVSMMENRELGLALGADDYFVKPVDRERLVSRLAQMAPPQAPARRTRLLVVDDDPTLHALLDAALGGLGYDVAHAHSGRDGIEQASREAPDAMILDLMMPDVTGFEVAEALKQREATAHVPIIVLTAKDLSPEERDRLRGRVGALVQKGPSASSRLVEAIRELETRQPREVARA